MSLVGLNVFTLYPRSTMSGVSSLRSEINSSRISNWDFGNFGSEAQISLKVKMRSFKCHSRSSSTSCPDQLSSRHRLRRDHRQLQLPSPRRPLQRQRHQRHGRLLHRSRRTAGQTAATAADAAATAQGMVASWLYPDF